MFKKTLVAASFAAASLTGGASQAAVFDLAFIMDESGSVGGGNYTNAMNSLASALEASMTQAVLDQDQYNITVISFSASNGGRAGGAATDVDVSSTLVTNTTELATVTAAIRAATYNGGNTDYRAAFDKLRSLTGALTNGAAGSIINMMTDGEPCLIGNCPVNSTERAAIQASRDALKGDGWDSLSFEAVTSGPDVNYLSRLGFDALGDGARILNNAGQITDPLNDAFVLKVANFGDDYDAAIGAKVAKIVDPDPVPVPAALPLLAGGLALFGFVGRRRRAAA